MNSSMKPDSRRILIIDDNRAIHEDFGKILGGAASQNVALAAMEDELFGEAAPARVAVHFELCSAFQGRDGFEMVQSAENCGKPFALAFVDVRMPPGWDGVETIEHLWQVAPNLQTVICTAYSDYSREQIHERLGNHDRLQFLRKPFEPSEVHQLAFALTEKWNQRQCRTRQAA